MLLTSSIVIRSIETRPTIDVSDVPTELSKRGAWVEVMGARVTVDDLTDRAGTIGYELLSRLSNRVHRIYIEGRPA